MNSLRQIAATASMVLLGLMPLAGMAQPAAKLVIGIDEDANTLVGIWGRLNYAEISRRLGIAIEVRTFPQQRRSEMADSGAIDGETARIYAYGAAHPNLVRVEEVLADLHFGLYAANPALRLQRLEDLSTSALRGEYRRGILFCEKALKAVLPGDRLSDVADSAQGARKLLAGRTDVFCDLELAMLSALHDPAFEGAAGVRKLLDLGSIPTYPYLHKRHAELAPRMAKVIKQMNAEGLVEAYRLQAQRQLGWMR